MTKTNETTDLWRKAWISAHDPTEKPASIERMWEEAREAEKATWGAVALAQDLG